MNVLQFLLSSSVDETVRLWQVGSSDECIRVFSHKSFGECFLSFFFNAAFGMSS